MTTTEKSHTGQLARDWPTWGDGTEATARDFVATTWRIYSTDCADELAERWAASDYSRRSARAWEPFPWSASPEFQLLRGLALPISEAEARILRFGEILRDSSILRTEKTRPRRTEP